ncbi:MAG: hypothetical protein ABI548_03930 [Polyangiaceae bacterium]
MIAKKKKNPNSHSSNTVREQRQALRKSLEEQKTAAIKAADWPAVLALQAQLDAIPRSKSGHKGTAAVYRDPDDLALARYDERTVHGIAVDLGKLLKLDFGNDGGAGGIVKMLREAAISVREELSPALEKAVCSAVHEKFVERTHGIGCSYVEGMNQILKKVVDAKEIKDLSLPARGPDLWLGRHEPGSHEATFVALWADWESELAKRTAAAVEQDASEFVPESDPAMPAAPIDSAESPPTEAEEPGADEDEPDDDEEPESAPLRAAPLSELLEDA